MYLWKWLSNFKWRTSDIVISTGKLGGEYEIFRLLLTYHQGLGKLYEDELIKRLKDLIKNADNMSNPGLLKYLGYALLGKIEFEKNLLPLALNHFEEAFKNYVALGYNDPDEEARLHAWIGLTSFKLGDYHKARENFRKALFKLEGKKDKKPIIGELKALLADALFFVSPNEAIQESESAHEILKDYISPFLISNAVKLGTGLIVRNYIEDGYSVIREAVEKIPEVSKLLNKGFIKTLKFLEMNAKKSIFYLEPATQHGIKNMLISLEALKGIYYIYRKIVKPNIDTPRLLMFNSKIVSNLKKAKKVEEFIRLKNNFVDKTEMLGIYSISDYPIYGVEQKLGQLEKQFGEIAVLSFISNIKTQEYRITLYKRNGIIETIVTDVVEIDDGILESRDMTGEEASSFLADYMPTSIIDALASLSENSLLLISPDGNLFSVPWELLPYPSREFPHIGLALNTVYVSSIMDITFWAANSRRPTHRSFYIRSERNMRQIAKKLNNLLNEIGYWKVKKIIGDPSYDLSAEVPIFIYLGELKETSDGDLYMNLGGAYFSILDIEKIKLRGHLAILSAPCSLESIIDEFGAHNMTISFYLSGFKSVIGNISKEINENELYLFIENVLKGRSIHLIENILQAKKMMYQKGIKWWSYVLMGNPTIAI